MKERALGPSADDKSDATSRPVGRSEIVAECGLLSDSSWGRRLDSDLSVTVILAKYV